MNQGQIPGRQSSPPPTLTQLLTAKMPECSRRHTYTIVKPSACQAIGPRDERIRQNQTRLTSHMQTTPTFPPSADTTRTSSLHASSYRLTSTSLAHDAHLLYAPLWPIILRTFPTCVIFRRRCPPAAIACCAIAGAEWIRQRRDKKQVREPWQ